jgi:hypothetical protein
MLDLKIETIAPCDASQVKQTQHKDDVETTETFTFSYPSAALAWLSPHPVPQSTILRLAEHLPTLWHD